MFRSWRAVMGAVSLFPCVAAAQWCRPHWTDEFSTGGPDAAPTVMAVFDDGRGPALYVGGPFHSVGEVAAAGVARWDGVRWEALGDDGPATARGMVVFDDGSGSGPGLHVSESDSVWRWDRQGWRVVSHEPGTLFGPLVVHDQGGGPRLCAAAQQTAHYPTLWTAFVAEWTGSTWARVGEPFKAPGYAQIRCLASAPIDGTPALLAGGWFTDVGDAHAEGLAQWNGAAWEEVAGGLTQWQGTATVNAMTWFDDGASPALYIGGDFFGAGGSGARQAARLHQGVWEAAGDPSADIHSLVVVPGRAGPRLYAGGRMDGWPEPFALSGVIEWTGQGWSAVGGSIGFLSARVDVLGAYDDGRGGGPKLYAAGLFGRFGDRAAGNMARLDAGGWSGLRPNHGLSDMVRTLTVFDDGGGPALYAGGRFRTAGDAPAWGVARWRDGAWSALGTGIEGDVAALLPFRGAAGTELYAGGQFWRTGSPEQYSLARWDGRVWSRCGTQVGFQVLSLAAFDDGVGGGPAVYAGSWGPQGAVLRWEGEQFHTVGPSFGSSAAIHALTVYDAGDGPALYAGGRFELAAGAPADAVARWNGREWSALPGNPLGASDEVRVMKVVRQGSREVLYLGGRFVGPSNADVISWDGSLWTVVATGLSGTPEAIEFFDDGTGPALYAGGLVSVYGSGGYARSVARWDGAQWQPVEQGVGDEADDRWVSALLTFDDGSGPALFAAGEFSTASGRSAGRIAKLVGCRGGACYANCDGLIGEPVLDVRDFVCFLGRFAAGDAYANCDGSTVPPVLNVGDLLCFQDRFAAGCR